MVSRESHSYILLRACEERLSDQEYAARISPGEKATQPFQVDQPCSHSDSFVGSIHSHHTSSSGTRAIFQEPSIATTKSHSQRSYVVGFYPFQAQL